MNNDTSENNLNVLDSEKQESSDFWSDQLYHRKYFLLERCFKASGIGCGMGPNLD